MTKTPYTYLIGWSSVGKYYYGVRYAKDCNPEDLWVSYFTSSKLVKEYRKKIGEPDIIKVRKIFKTAENAIEWERKVILRMNMLYEDKWLNMNCAAAIRISELSEEHKKRISLSNKGKHDPIHALNASKAAIMVNTGKKRPEHSKIMKEKWANKTENERLFFNKNLSEKNKGVKKTENHKKKLSESTNKRLRICCLKCHKPQDKSDHKGIWICHYVMHHRNCQ
jgi:hypothetical protein